MRNLRKFSSGAGCEEAPVLEYYTNGLRGGDAGHGGVDTLVIRMFQGHHHVRVTDHDGKVLLRAEDYEVGDVLLQSGGDWEQTGLAFAIIALAEQLKADPEVYDRWLSEVRKRAREARDNRIG